MICFDIYWSMNKTDENILRATKEIVVKFIEMGRLSPSNIHESFKDIYDTVDSTVKSHTGGKTPADEKPA